MAQLRALASDVRRGTVTIATSATSGTASIAAVVPANAVLLYKGQTTAGAVALGQNKWRAYLVLTNGTTITATRNTADATYSVVVAYELLVFAPGVVFVQRGVFSVVGGTSGDTATIGKVVRYLSWINWLGVATTDTAGAPQPRFEMYLDFNSDTELAVKFGTDPFGSGFTWYISWEVVEAVWL